jgi:hypothetical protein
VYDQCGFNPQSSAQQSQEVLLRAEATNDSTVQPYARASADGDAAALTAAAPTGLAPVLGSYQRWCGGREFAQPAWNVLPAVAKALNMKPVTNVNLILAGSLFIECSKVICCYWGWKDAT